MGLPQARELSFAAQRFSTIEVNSAFYRLQRPASFLRWRRETPDDFVFAIKGSRYITHMLKLQNADAGLANFWASGLLALGPKLGPILWQFPQRSRFDERLFEGFLKRLPKSTGEALSIARGHDARVEGRTWLEIERDVPLRHAIEIRHDSFRSAAFVDLLRRHRVALVCADTVDWPLLMDLTADFIYGRLHGSQELYVSGYDDTALDHWAHLVTQWSAGMDPPDAQRIGPPSPTRTQGRDVFIYFDNDAKVRAPVDAAGLARRVARDRTPMTPPR